MNEKLFTHTPEEAAALGRIQFRIDSVYPGEKEPAVREAVKNNLKYVDSLYQEAINNPNSAKAKQAIDAMQAVVKMVSKHEDEIPKQNVEMLAAERLLRLAPHIDDHAVRKDVILNIIMRSAIRSIEAERGYYLGLLYHFTSLKNYQRIEDQLYATNIISDASTRSELYDTSSPTHQTLAKGVATFRPLIEEIATEYAPLRELPEGELDSQLERLLRTIELLHTDFDETNLDQIGQDEVHLAKLIAYYYENPRHGEDELLLNLDLGETEKSEEGTDHPLTDTEPTDTYFKVALRAGYHPSREKIEQAKAEQEPLVDFRVVNKNEYYSDTKAAYTTLEDQVPINNVRGEFLYHEIRVAIDQGNTARKEQLITELYTDIWKHVCMTDEAAAKQFGDKDSILILAYTLRNKMVKIDPDHLEDLEPATM